MKMTELLRYDIPPEIIQLWQTQESKALLPLQEMVIKRHDLFGKGNLQVQAPTSSGKTFIGEMAAIHTALRRKKVIYLVPLKALAEEKFREFQGKYEPYGLKVVISTRERREFDQDLESGNYSIAIVVYEKLAQLLVRRPERLQEVELIIADELEILSDPDRGAQIEILLTCIVRAEYRILALSAVIGQADRLAKWMGADLVHFERRPVELRYGVLHEGVFRYRTYNDYSEAEEQFVYSHSDSPWELLTENICAFAEQVETCLVFVKAKHESRRGAELLADRIDLPPSTTAIEELQALEATHSRDALLNTLAHGVGFHNADLSCDERRAVEEGFRRGEVGVLVSTSTLAMGMNLPAQNVFLATDKWHYDRRFGMPWKTPILRSEYENMGGRAGRCGAGLPFGRSILVAPTPFDQETLWRRYVEGEREEIEPRLAQEPLEDHLLRLVASYTCGTEDDLNDFLENTLTGAWVWSESLPLEEFQFRTRAAVNRAIDAGMLTKSPEGRLQATPLGQAVAAKGVSIATANQLAAWINESETRCWIDADLIIAAALTPDGRMLQVTLTAREYEHADYPGILKRLTRDEDITSDVPLNRIRNCTLMPFFEEVRAIKATLGLLDWIDENEVYDIEEKFHILMGQIRAAADQISWLVDATAALATASGADETFIDRIATLAERISRGIREEAIPLARLGLPSLTRNTVSALEAHGLHTPEGIANTPSNRLTKWVGAKDARAIAAWARQMAEAQPVESPAADAAVSPSPVLIIDDRHPAQILVDGTTVPLQEKQYRLIRALAAAPGECIPYDTIYSAVWGETIVESNQMHFQKRRLLERIREALPDRPDMVKTVPKRGFRLALYPEEVVLLTATAAVAV
jgi:ATP-dependent DNA helicase